MAGAGAGILTLRPSPRYCYQPGMASGFAGASAVHQGLLGKKSAGQHHCQYPRGIHSPGHPSSPPPSALWGLSHCIVTLELFQRLCEDCTSLLPSFPHVHPLALTHSVPQPHQCAGPLEQHSDAAATSHRLRHEQNGSLRRRCHEKPE